MAELQRGHPLSPPIAVGAEIEETAGKVAVEVRLGTSYSEVLLDAGAADVVGGEGGNFVCNGPRSACPINILTL